MMNKQHEVEVDRAGFANRSRLTCHTCGETLVRQPYMTYEIWITHIEQFEQAHPSEVISNYKKRIKKL